MPTSIDRVVVTEVPAAFTAAEVLARLREHIRSSHSLQETSWLLRDVLPAAGHLLGDLRVRQRKLVTELLADGERIVTLVQALGIPRITLQSWTSASAKAPSANPVGISPATPEHLERARPILPVEDILACIDDAAASLDTKMKAAAYLTDAVNQAAELVPVLREIRKENGVARLAEGVRRQVVVQDLGITTVTVHEWSKLAGSTKSE